MLRWITRFQLSIQRMREAWNNTYLPIADPNNAEVRAYIAGLPAEEKEKLLPKWRWNEPMLDYEISMQ